MAGAVSDLSRRLARKYPATETTTAGRYSKDVSLRPDYMLDTDTVSFALRGQGQVGPRLLQQRPSALCVSSITIAELRYGAEMKRSRKLHQLIDTFAESIEVVPFDRAAADRFGIAAAS